MSLIDHKREAYDVACLGVTHKDWETLGLASLENFQLDIARKSFIHIKDYKYLNLIHNFQVLKNFKYFPFFPFFLKIFKIFHQLFFSIF